jgi:hypothetical protein
MGGVADRRHLIDRVQRAELGALGDRHDTGLGVVGVAEQQCGLVDLLRTQLAVGRREVHQLGADDAFGRPRLVGGDVRPVAAHDRLGRSDEGEQRDDVGAGAVERQQRRDVAAEQLSEGVLAPAGPRIVAVGQGVAVVGGGDGVEDGGMGAGGVVAGERAHGRRWELHPPSMGPARVTGRGPARSARLRFADARDGGRGPSA